MTEFENQKEFIQQYMEFYANQHIIFHLNL